MSYVFAGVPFLQPRFGVSFFGRGNPDASEARLPMTKVLAVFVCSSRFSLFTWCTSLDYQNQNQKKQQL